MENYADSLCWVVGIDGYYSWVSCKDWSGLFEFGQVMEMRRTEIESEESFCSAELREVTRLRISNKLQDLKDNPAGKLMFIHNTEFSISSSALREKLANGQPTGNMLPESVNKDIKKRDLYSHD